MNEPRSPSAVRLAAFYFALFASIGVSLPYLPQHFRSLGFSGTQFGFIAGIGPAMSLVAAPVWGYLADRTRRPDRLLSLAAVGVVAGQTILTQVRAFLPAVGAMTISGFFGAPQSVLIDSMTLTRTLRFGGSYSRIRLWGSLGFVASSFLFGRFYQGEPEEVPRVVVAALVMSLASATISFAIRGEGASQRPEKPEALGLLRRGDVLLLLVIACIHWIACSPYHLLFVVHNKSIGIAPSVAGPAMALGVVAEVAAMATFPAIAVRWSLPRILATSFAASAARWWIIGTTSWWPLMAGIQVIHGLTFGAFFVGSVTYLGSRVRAESRATGQALLVASAFGLGGIVGNWVTGRAFDAFGGSSVFRAAALLELAPMLLALRLRGRDPPLSGASRRPFTPG